MAWNPAPEVADCREIARRWGKEQVIIIGIDGNGRFQLATYGETQRLCACAYILGRAALDGIEKKVATK
jgi:hypothetical protein